jgi:hypothetical protein
MFRLLDHNSCRRILPFYSMLATAVAWPTSAFAQIPTQAPAGHADVIPAVIVFFGVVLGMILVCRSAGRSADMKLEALDEE